MSGRPELRNAGAIVTGAGSGIGAATAICLARRGARVALVGRTEANLRAVEEAIRAQGGSAGSFIADVRRAEEALVAIGRAASFLGGIDLLVNCAGVYRQGSFAEISDQTIDELVDTNLKGVLFTTRAALRCGIRPGGAIVNIASMSAVRALEDQVVYAATKAAVVAFGAALARELADDEITVNTVSPGPARTGILRSILPEEQIATVQDALRQRIPLHRLAEPEEIADAVAYMAGARFATGAHLVLDGGVTL